MGLFDRLFKSAEDEASNSWPTSPGEISEINIRQGRTEGLVAEIVYSYCANGEYYSGVFQKKFPPFTFEKEARKYIARFENVNKVVVHYRPDKPEVSTLLEDLEIEN